MYITLQLLNTQERPIEGVFITLHCLDVSTISFTGISKSDGQPAWKPLGSLQSGHTTSRVWNAHWQITVYSMGKSMPIIPVVFYVFKSIHVCIQLTGEGYVVDMRSPEVGESGRGGRKQIISAVDVMLEKRARSRLV